MAVLMLPLFLANPPPCPGGSGQHRITLHLNQRLGIHSLLTPTAAIAGYCGPASRRQAAPISRACSR